MAHPSELIDELIKFYLKPALKELGFKNAGSTFFRSKGDLTEVISPQKSQSNDSTASKFTINLGVYWPSVNEVLVGIGQTFPPKEYECTLRQRIGPLFDNGRDFWWVLTPDSNIESVGKEVIQKLHTFALPWLLQATSLEQAIGLAQPREAIVLHFLKGEKIQAVRLIEEQILKNKLSKGLYKSK